MFKTGIKLDMELTPLGVGMFSDPAGQQAADPAFRHASHDLERD